MSLVEGQIECYDNILMDFRLEACLLLSYLLCYSLMLFLLLFTLMEGKDGCYNKYVDEYLIENMSS